MKKNVTFDRSNVKLHTGTPKVFVQEDKRMVVTVIDYQLVVPEIIQRLFNEIYTDPGKWDQDISGTATGIAICAEGDTFDIEKGKKISRAKAETNAYRNAAKSLNKRFLDLMDIFNTFGGMVDEFVSIKFPKAHKHNVSYINKLAQ